MGGQGSPHGIDDKLGLALNPNRAEMPRKGSYDQVSPMVFYVLYIIPLMWIANELLVKMLC